jgi:putative flippase GtrA
MKILFNLIQSKYIKIIFLHGIVSCVGALIDFLLFLTFHRYFLWTIDTSYLISIVVVSIFGFLGHTYITFQVNRIYLKNLIFFMVQLSISGTLGLILLKYFLFCNIQLELSKAFQLCSTFIFNIFFGKLISFKKR